MSRTRIKTKPQTIQNLSENVFRAFQQVDEDKRRSLIALDNIYRRTKIAASYPWPLSWFLFWREDWKAKKAMQKQADIEAKAQADAQAAIDAEPVPTDKVVTMDKSIVGPDGRPA